jgi:hypothetical protein
MKIEVFELAEAIDYYNYREPGLGIRLKNEVRSTIGDIAIALLRPRVRSGDCRRVNLRIFPLFVANFTTTETIWIVAIAHAYRYPEYWLDRRKKVSQPDEDGNG